MKKYTVSEFADKIRDKYPNAYDDLSDVELVKIWLRKYPNYEKFINFSRVHYQEEETSGGIWNGFKKLIVFIFIILITFFGIDYFNNSNNNNTDNVSSQISTVTINDSNNESNDYTSDSLDSENSENSEDLGYYETSSKTYENSNSSYSQNSQQEICYRCKGTGKCGKCSVIFRKSYYKGNGSYENRNESLLGYVMCSDCYGRGHKQSKRIEGGWEPGEDCYVRGCENGWVFCDECNSSGNGKLLGKCKECKGTGFRN
jgi:hypothetical protein